MPADDSQSNARLLAFLAILTLAFAALAAGAGYEAYYFRIERSIYENQVLGQCFDGRKSGESVEDARFTVRPSPMKLRRSRHDPPNPQLLCDIPVYVYECPAWATAQACSPLNPQELPEFSSERTLESGVFCFGQLGWFSWGQRTCDAKVWSCTFGPCNAYQHLVQAGLCCNRRNQPSLGQPPRKSERLCAANITSGSYLCHFDPAKPDAGVSHTSFGYPFWRGLAVAVLSAFALGAAAPAAYLAATRLSPPSARSVMLVLTALVIVIIWAYFGCLIQAAIVMLLPGVTPYSILGAPGMPQVHHVTVADLGGEAWKSEEPVAAGFNQPSARMSVEIVMAEVLMIFVLTFAILGLIFLGVLGRRTSRRTESTYQPLQG